MNPTTSHEALVASTRRYHFFEWLWLIVAIPVFGLPIYTTFVTVAWLTTNFGALGWIAGIPFTFFVAILLIVLTTGLFTRMLHKIEPGCYALGAQSHAVTHWLLRYGISNYLRLSGIHPLVLSNPTTRRIYFWLHGAHINPTSRIAYDVRLLDISLIQVGEGSKIGAMTTISGHYSNEHSFVLGRIVIGKNVLIGGNALIGPNTVFGDGSVLEATSSVLPGTKIGAGEIWGGNPARLRRTCRSINDTPAEVHHVTAL